MVITGRLVRRAYGRGQLSGCGSHEGLFADGDPLGLDDELLGRGLVYS